MQSRLVRKSNQECNAGGVGGEGGEMKGGRETTGRRGMQNNGWKGRDIGEEGGIY